MEQELENKVYERKRKVVRVNSESNERNVPLPSLTTNIRPHDNNEIIDFSPN